MLQIRDFVPKLIRTPKTGGILAQMFLTAEETFETFESALAAASTWIEQSGVQVINVETVVLPNIWAEEGSADPALGVSIGSGQGRASWHQFIRVWYRTS